MTVIRVYHTGESKFSFFLFDVFLNPHLDVESSFYPKFIYGTIEVKRELKKIW